MSDELVVTLGQRTIVQKPYLFIICVLFRSKRKVSNILFVSSFDPNGWCLNVFGEAAVVASVFISRASLFRTLIVKPGGKIPFHPKISRLERISVRKFFQRFGDNLKKQKN